MIDYQMGSNRKWATWRHKCSFPIWKSTNCHFSNSKCPYNVITCSFPISKTSNDWFSNRKWTLFRHVAHFLFDNRSLVDFPIGNERKREFHPAEIRFYLHKEFRAAEIRFSLHKECRAGEIRFYLHKDFERKLMKISNDLFQKISALRAPIC